MKASSDHASDIVKNNSTGHQGSDGSTFMDRIQRYSKKGKGSMIELLGTTHIVPTKSSIEQALINLIVDDGFQHRQLSRKLDLVLLDATEDFKNYQLFPRGRARESWKNLRRADALILTKTNLSERDLLKKIEIDFPTKKIFYWPSIRDTTPQYCLEHLPRYYRV